MGYVYNNLGQMQQQTSTPTGRAGPNTAGGLVTKYSPDFMFNPDDPCTLYNIPFMIGTGGKIPNDYQAGAIATWVWKGQGPCPWPGLNPGDDPRAAAAAAAQQTLIAQQMQLPSVAASTDASAAASTDASAALTYQATAPTPVSSNTTVLIVILIAVLGIGAFFLLRRKKKEKHEEEIVEQPTEQSTASVARRKRCKRF